MEQDAGPYKGSRSADSQPVHGMRGFRIEGFVTGNQHGNEADENERTEKEDDENNSVSAGGNTGNGSRLAFETASSSRKEAFRFSEGLGYPGSETE